MTRQRNANRRLARQQRPRSCFFGVGSPHGDDRVGWVVAERLQREPLATLRIATCRTPLDLMHWADTDASFSGADRWVICDACSGPGRPGTVRRFVWPTFRRNVLSERPHTHGLGVVRVLELLDHLRQLPANVVLFTVEIASAAPDQRLSPVVEASVPRLVASIRREVATS